MTEGQFALLPVRLGFVKVFLVRGVRKHVLVDTGMAGCLPGIAVRGEQSGFSLKDIGLVVVTHAHPDHTGSLADVVRETGATVVMHRLEAGQKSAGVEPDELVDDELDLRQYGVEGRVIWTPGHTRGSLSIVLESGDAIVGDLVLPRYMAFGPPAIAFWSASRKDSLVSIRKVLDLKPSVIMTSHGGPYGPEALARLVR